MKITFINMGAESLGIEYLSSVLKKNGHETDLVFDPALFNDQNYFSFPFLNRVFSSRKRLIKQVIRTKPDLIAFSVFTNSYLWACDIAKELKNFLKVPVVFGGIHPTSVPEKVIKNDFVDYLCIGECEYALLELVDSLENKKLTYNIKNVWCKANGKVIKNPVRPLIENLDELPFPDKSLFEKDINIRDHYMIMTSRGCPYACTYCCNNLLKKMYQDKGKYVRRRSVDNVIEELRLMKKKYKFKEVVIMDDVFTMDKKWLREFAKKYKKEINRPYRCQGHTSFFDREIAILLKNSGCIRVKFGVQSITESFRKRVLHRYESNEQNRATFRICDEVKLPYHIDHIFFPFEGEIEQKKAAEFYNHCKRCKKILAFRLEYLPKTEIITYAQKSGFINDRVLNSIENGQEKMFFCGGSIRDKKLNRVFNNFEIMFKIIPLLPKSLNKFILDRKIYKSFYILPNFASLFLEVLTAIKTRDHVFLLELKSLFQYYSKHALKNLVSV